MYFDKSYDREEFLRIFQTKICPNFIRKEEKLNSKRETKYFSENYTQKLGSIEFENWTEISVLEIKQSSSKDPRVTITRDAFKLLLDQWIDKAIIIFHNADSTSYRLSLLTLKHAWDGKEESSPKRYSFLLWPDEKVKTPNDYLIKQWPVKDFEDLISRFDVEIVRKEFFRLYLNLFIELYKSLQQNPDFQKEIIENKQQNPVKFAKNLMGKIIFLYFIQKKWRLWVKEDQQRWQWDMDFIKTLFDDSISWENMIIDVSERKGNFYNDYLEPLFYGWLSKDRSEQGDIHSYFIWKDGWKIKVPYLNGWLFSNEYDREGTDILPDNKIFEDIILSFDRYNFTIDEDDPYDREVAIDPEMLGKIFETMISVSSENIEEILQTYEKKTKWNPLDIDNIQNIDIENDLNKKFWAFYTPREIVHYMTKESLLYYLVNWLKERWIYLKWESDQKVQEYLEEKIRKLFRYKERYLTKNDVQNRLNIEENEFISMISYIDRLLNDVKVLDPAVWSWAFPMWLLHEIRSLKKYINDLFLEREITDYEIKKNIISNSIYWVDIEPGAIDIARLRFRLSLLVDTEKPEPLPNLEFKFVCADTLTPLKVQKNWLDLFRNDVMFKSYQTLMNKLFRPSKLYKKEELIWKINVIVNFFRNKDDTEFNQQLKTFDPFNTENSAKFFDPEFMFWEEKFDIVIWNPPYIQLQKNWWYLANLYENIWYKSFARTGDLYCLFYEHAYELLKEWGNCTFITSNKWMRTKYWEKLRDYLSKNTNPLMLVDLWPDVFDTAAVDSNILIWQKKKVNTFNMKALDLSKEKQIRSIENYHKKIIHMSNLDNDVRTILSPIKLKIKTQIEEIWTPIKEWDINIYRWILTWYNKAFIIDNNTKEKLITEDSESSNIIKPVLWWSDLNHFYTKKKELRIIDTHNWYKKNWKQIEPIDIEKYQWIKSRLDWFKDNLYKRFDMWITPYNLRNCAYHEDFNKEKVVWLNLNRKWKFSYVEPGVFLEASLNFIATNKYAKFLTSILSSKLHLFYFKMIGRMHDNWGFMCKIDTISNFPVPKIPEEEQLPFVDIIEQILAKKKINPDADTSEEEKKIDQMVYKLYGLSEEEVKVVEGSLG